ncbi:response regulator transcription factor [Luteolibacter sp. LG18]|uniref:response regulator transcription factor n=1 Tax=Luteolibacter sp. LG18 TaxID=2819286 RepID=UPI002B2DDBFE|nr:DNA-binding response regulator [Luteolibacter sp. LG18]
MNTATIPITVALVEDDPRIRRSLTTILAQEEDIRCVGAFPSAEEALMELPSLKPKVLLMDVNLPGMTGVDCVRQLSGKVPGTQILMLTVHEDADVIFNSLAAGASGYLLKPPRASELIAAVRDVFTGGAPMTSLIARKVVQSFNHHAPAANEAEGLSPRETEVLDRLAKGFAYKEIAADLGISYSTVQTHIERIYEKLHVHSRSHAVMKYLGIK